MITKPIFTVYTPRVSDPKINITYLSDCYKDNFQPISILYFNEKARIHKLGNFIKPKIVGADRFFPFP
jgi:hypothetical protein